MGYGIRTGFIGNLDQALGNQWTGDRGTQQVFTFVDGVGPEHGEHIIPGEFLPQIFHVDFLDAPRLCLCPGRFHFLTLTHIGSKSHDLAIIDIFQPLQNYRGIQAA